MDKTTIENLKQFKNFNELLVCFKQEYMQNINKFIKLDNNKITGYKIPIIVDILPNKEIIFSDNSNLGLLFISDSILNANIDAVSRISLGNFLNNSKKEFVVDLDVLFKQIINKK